MASNLPKLKPLSWSTPPFIRSSTAPELGAKTPHLTAILSRVASKAKNAFTFKFNSESPSFLPASAEYRPSSLQSFLARLETFKLATYANKPTNINAVAASRCGWTNDGKDRLVCGLCNSSWVVAGREGMSRDAANALIEKQRQGLVDNHKKGCPWKTRQCDPSIYCVPLKTPTVMVKELKENATTLEPLVSDIGIRHPLTSKQVSSLKKTLSSEPSSLHTEAEPSADAMDVDVPNSNSQKVELSEAAILASLFGWALVPPTSTSESSPRRQNPSASMSASRAPSRRGSPSRSASRRSSFSVAGGSASPAPESRAPLFRLPANLFAKRENAMLQCTLCQRRVGLWAFTPRKPDETTTTTATNTDTNPPASDDLNPSSSPSRPKKPLPQRQFDLLKEHRSYCPYVVKSTTVPSLPDLKSKASNANNNGHMRSSSSLSHLNAANAGAGAGANEGWRAVLSVVLRYRMAQRHRNEYYDVFGGPNGATNQDDGTAEAGSSSEVDNVKAMVAGVKEQGGRELLKYVKGLLG
ncbi:hypothetical protein EST38_g4091 [Candolleomyces aberdarensis]|uniref:Zf-C3HC-domain-containing protein n=1 Tax=Candolleomyces aberdarensis TaxID=2316362 RepID=A0A4Q2DNW0_9AGAR|nr:hypothetical protein EST38_g4091 [Candolleomyces aberdarensis]